MALHYYTVGTCSIQCHVNINIHYYKGSANTRTEPCQYLHLWPKANNQGRYKTIALTCTVYCAPEARAAQHSALHRRKIFKFPTQCAPRHPAVRACKAYSHPLENGRCRRNSVYVHLAFSVKPQPQPPRASLQTTAKDQRAH